MKYMIMMFGYLTLRATRLRLPAPPAEPAG